MPPESKIEGVDIPPKRDTGEGKPGAPVAQHAKRAGPGMAKLREQLTDLYVSIGTMVVTPLDRLAGTLMIASAPDLAQTWVDLAETNPAVKRALQKMVEAGGWGGVVIAHGMLLMPVLANRGLFPDHVAQGSAMLTVLQYQESVPTIGELFTHERFRQPATNGSQPHG